MNSKTHSSDTTIFSDLTKDEEMVLSSGGFWSWVRRAWNDIRNFLSEYPVAIPGTQIEVGSSGAMDRALGDFWCKYFWQLVNFAILLKQKLLLEEDVLLNPSLCL